MISNGDPLIIIITNNNYIYVEINFHIMLHYMLSIINTSLHSKKKYSYLWYKSMWMLTRT